MARPFLLAQLSDPHIGADWGAGDPATGLAAAVVAVRAYRPDAVLVSGDLAEHAADAEYERAGELLAPFDVPVHVLPGNHDDRRALSRHFGGPGADGEPVQYTADLGPLRLVVLDTTRPGEDPGELDAARLGWLDTELAAAPQQPYMQTRLDLGAEEIALAPGEPAGFALHAVVGGELVSHVQPVRSER